LAIIAQNPKDFQVKALHALCTRLCIKLDQGMLTVREATDNFEKARAALIRQREREEMEKRNGKTKRPKYVTDFLGGQVFAEAQEECFFYTNQRVRITPKAQIPRAGSG
jgi:hypothetical protein